MPERTEESWPNRPRVRPGVQRAEPSGRVWAEGPRLEANEPPKEAIMAESVRHAELDGVQYALRTRTYTYVTYVRAYARARMNDFE